MLFTGLNSDLIFEHIESSNQLISRLVRVNYFIDVTSVRSSVRIRKLLGSKLQQSLF
jgi:hypothetical protein